MAANNHDINWCPPSETPPEQLASDRNVSVNDAHKDSIPGLCLLYLSMQRKGTRFDAAGILSLAASCHGRPTTPIKLPPETTENAARTPALTSETLRQHDRHFTSHGDHVGQSEHADGHPVLNNGLPCPSSLKTSSSLGDIESSEQNTIASLAATSASLAASYSSLMEPRTTPRGGTERGGHDRAESPPPRATQDVSQSVAGIGAQFESSRDVVDKLSGVQAIGAKRSGR